MEEMAVVVALAVFARLASALAEEALSDPNKLEVTCNKQGTFTPTEGLEITVDETTLTLNCPDTYTAQPAQSNGEQPTVYSSGTEDSTVQLREYCSGATGKTLAGGTGLELYFPTVPSRLADFYLKCTPNSREESDMQCTVHVLVQSKPQSGEDGPSNGDGNQQEGSGQAGGPAGVQTCVHTNRTLTVRVPEKGSLAQVACESGSTLYPTAPDKIFSKDCKTQETLKDMTRTQTTGGTSVRDGAAAPTYTLKATKKPAKKTLCYLCAKTGTSAEDPGSAENYCTIYVESGAGTQFALSFIVALALPCVPALFQYT